MALQDVTMPAMGADMTEGTVVKWLKAEGDSVARGDKLAEIETDKTVVEMESYSEGVLRKIILGDGSRVPVGTLLAYVGDPDDELPDELSDDADSDTETVAEDEEPVEDEAAAPAEETVEAEPEPVAEAPVDTPAETEPEPADDAAPTPVAVETAPEPVESVAAVVEAPVASDEPERVKASPMARRLAREAGYDISLIAGTGPGGRITRDDVLEYTPEPVYVPAPAPVIEVAEPVEPDVEVAEPEVQVEEAAEPAIQIEEVVEPAVLIDGADIELSSMRQAIARVTTRSKTEAPHYYVTTGIDMTDAMSFRAQFNAELEDSGDRVSVNDMIIKALALALVKYPKWNSFYGDGKLEGHSDVNVGIAIALDAGLIVPALIGVQNMTLVDVSRAAKDMGGRARGEGGTLTQEELTAGTFSTSNLGMFDIDVFAAIIVPPQAGILAVGSAKPTPVVRDGEVVVRTVMNATISADHRVGDGAEAAVLLNEVKSNLERPLRLIL